MADAQMPDTKPYRVVGVGATYQKPVEALGENGEVKIVNGPALALRGEVIDLIPFEARRLEALGAVRPAEDAPSYDEMSDEDLTANATERRLDVRGSAVDGSVRREDLINALMIHDQGIGVTGGTVGATTTPGNVALAQSGTSELENTYQGGEGSEPSPAGAPDAHTESVQAIASWIQNEKPNIDDTVSIAGDSPTAARKVLEAESVATGGDPRSGVESRLSRLAEQDEPGNDPGQE